MDRQIPNPEAYEIIGRRTGEYVLILDCLVEIMPRGTGIELGESADVAGEVVYGGLPRTYQGRSTRNPDEKVLTNATGGIR